MADDITVQVEIEGPGGWFDLEDQLGGYELHAESFASRTVVVRKVEAEGDWVAGTYPIRAVQGNVTEPIVVYVAGATTFECQSRTAALEDALRQLTFGMRITVGDAKQSWSCVYSEYTIESSQPLMVAKRVIVRAQVQHLPAVVLEQV